MPVGSFPSGEVAEAAARAGEGVVPVRGLGGAHEFQPFGGQAT